MVPMIRRMRGLGCANAPPKGRSPADGRAGSFRNIGAASKRADCEKDEYGWN
ncbi:MAG: hypothetical protein P8Q29_12360 [Tateyamaria sp.]|nr:hypothetical protein [Tateyamaria sp.]